MTTQYFTDIITAARERHDVNYITCAAEIADNGSFTYSVHLTVVIDPDAELPEWGSPKCYEMVHIHHSKMSLEATIDECVRRSNFDNGIVETPMLEMHILDDVPPMVPDDVMDALTGTKHDAKIADGVYMAGTVRDKT